MLHATLAAAEPLGVEVVALHVHHGLSPNADRWLVHCAARCRRWLAQGRPISFAFHRVTTRPGRGDSIEAWARKARYGALAQMAREHRAELILLGQHRRDQAETFLLQALRGGGVAGLAAMPAVIEREGLTWARPWLELPREHIESYVRQHRLRAVEDEGNDDESLARNRLRKRVWPALLDAFPGAEAALAQAARWSQQASAVVADEAARDLATVIGTSSDDSLDLAAWRALPPSRQSHVLRAWLRERTGISAPASLIDRVLREAKGDSRQRWPMTDGELRSHRGRLFHMRPEATIATAFDLVAVDLAIVGTHRLEGWPGSIRVEPAGHGGVPLTVARRLTVRARASGDRFQGEASRPPRSLKLQYQSAGIPAWQRHGPVLCCEGKLVFVAGLGIDARAMASPNEEQVVLHWLPNA